MPTDHVWHMETLAEVCRPIRSSCCATPYQVVDLDRPGERGGGIDWWLELTGRGGEGMVVKPCPSCTGAAGASPSPP